MYSSCFPCWSLWLFHHRKHLPDICTATLKGLEVGINYSFAHCYSFQSKWSFQTPSHVCFNALLVTRILCFIPSMLYLWQEFCVRDINILTSLAIWHKLCKKDIAFTTRNLRKNFLKKGWQLAFPVEKRARNCMGVTWQDYVTSYRYPVWLTHITDEPVRMVGLASDDPHWVRQTQTLLMTKAMIEMWERAPINRSLSW